MRYKLQKMIGFKSIVERKKMKPLKLLIILVFQRNKKFMIEILNQIFLRSSNNATPKNRFLEVKKYFRFSTKMAG